MDGKISQEPEKDFFFHLHDFDDPIEVEEEIEEDLPPPPPTFSEKELEDAKREAFENGRIEGQKQALDSIEQKSSIVLDQIGNHLNAILAQEEQRNKIFENEAGSFACALFEKLFPIYKEKHGFEEMSAAISSILEKQKDEYPIRLSVSPSVLEAIKSKFSNSDDSKIEITAEENMAEGTCELQWSRGGATISLEELCEEIRITLDQLLEDKATKGHDEVVEHAVGDPDE